jgi:quercetin dioxygenase-like cupin family protein
MKFLKFLFVLPLLVPAAYAQDIAHTALLSTSTNVTGESIAVPDHPKVIISEIVIAPGESLPMHKHPYPRYAYVKEGAVDVTLDEPRKSFHYNAGEAFVETTGWHFGKNNGSVPVKILAIDQIPQNKDSNTMMAVIK